MEAASSNHSLEHDRQIGSSTSHTGRQVRQQTAEELGMGESGKSPGWGQVVVIILAVFGAFGTGFLYLDSQISAGDAELRGAIKDSLQATTQLRTTVVALNTNVETLSTNVGKLTDSVDKLSQRVSYHDGLEDGKSRGGQ